MTIEQLNIVRVQHTRTHVVCMDKDIKIRNYL
jgi:hypothetical protein